MLWGCPHRIADSQFPAATCSKSSGGYGEMPVVMSVPSVRRAVTCVPVKEVISGVLP